MMYEIRNPKTNEIHDQISIGGDGRKMNQVILYQALGWKVVKIQ